MIREVLARARRRLLWNAVAAECARSVCAGLGVVILLLVLGTGILGWRWVCLIPPMIFAGGVWLALWRCPDPYRIARLIDLRLRLLDTLSTATVFWPEQPPRRCDEGMRLAQRRRAIQVAASVDLRKALPIRVPRRLYASAVVLALMAAGVLTFRYHSEGRLDLRAPASAAILQLLDEIKTEAQKLQRRLETPQAQADARREDSDGNQEKTEGDSATADPPGDVENASAEEKGEGKKEGLDPAGNQAEAENRKGGAEQGEGESNNSSNRGDGSQQREGASSTQQAADQSGSGSNLLSKVSDTMANLLSALKSPSNGNQMGESNRNPSSGAGQQKGDASRRGSQGSASRSADQPGSPDETNGGINAYGEDPDSHGEHRPGSGAGREDGSKELRSAEQLAAMGKISAIIGKRSKELSGTAYAEVASTRQELKAPYQARNVAHSNAREEVVHDEIPLELQDYVQQYFREVRKVTPREARPGKRR